MVGIVVQLRWADLDQGAVAMGPNLGQIEGMARHLIGALPSPQNILPSLPGGFFLEFVKSRADNRGNVGYDRVPHIGIFLKKLPEAFSFNFD